MKKVIIMSAVAAFLAACSSAPTVSESATKVESLKNWVDSIKTVVESSTTADSSTWASYAESFNTATAGINVDELDEVSKTAYTTITSAWEGIGSTYTAKIAAAKEEAAKAMMSTDSTMNANPDQTLIEKAVETGKEGANKVIDKTANAIKSK